MLRLFTLVFVPVLAMALLACDDRRDGGPAVDAAMGDSDGSAGTDAGKSDAAVDVDAGMADSGTTTDAGSVSFPTPEYNEEGCLTWASAQAICGSSSDGVACAAVAACGLSTEGQCSIDCEMATTLCITSTVVDSCLAAIGGSCDALSACNGWMHFSS